MKIFNIILVYGLWQSREQIYEKLGALKTNKEKVKALKVQLDFRKKALHYIRVIVKIYQKITIVHHQMKQLMRIRWHLKRLVILAEEDPFLSRHYMRFLFIPLTKVEHSLLTRVNV